MLLVLVDKARPMPNGPETYGTVEQHPKMEGRQLIMVIAPKKKK
jgi:translation initiation factor IF-3